MDANTSIESILNRFNFEHVHDVMVALGWGWGEDSHVPSVEEIKNHAEHLLGQVADAPGAIVDRGGFRAESSPKGWLKLSFVCETATATPLGLALKVLHQLYKGEEEEAKEVDSQAGLRLV